ncbi:hypothetical protein Pmani_010299 [Petrolisthes manimaculis]|uniref:CHK kinase-like domain-containing protein n=1 Tax=Petrolisthes manimaculis TaxID=1843537 RepID=A0AAE1Q4U0_9EUCA|nr:hypothetical protein Pmani_010299 [Petrolisthes manimaculis]
MSAAGLSPLTSQKGITEIWLGEILTHKFRKEALVTAFSAKAPLSKDGFLSEICYVEVIYSTQAEKDQRASLVVKFLPDVPEVREFVKEANLGQREIEFYNYSNSKEFKSFCKKSGLPHPVPKVYWSGLTDDALTIVLHNLNMDGYRMVNPAEGNNIEQIMSVLKSIAVIHSAGVASMRRHGSNHPLDIPFDSSVLLELLHKGLDIQDNMYANTHWAEILTLVRTRAADLVNIAKKHPLFSTIIHSDLWTGNVMFSADDHTVAIIDWQFAQIGNPICDIITLLFMSAHPTVYTYHLDQVLSCYWEKLTSAMKMNDIRVNVTYQQLRDNVERLWMYGYMFLTASLPDLLPNKITEDRFRAVVTFLHDRRAFTAFLNS